MASVGRQIHGPLSGLESALRECKGEARFFDFVAGRAKDRHGEKPLGHSAQNDSGELGLRVSEDWSFVRIQESCLISVVAGLIQERGRLLICQRRRGSLFELQWEFPGGKLHEGESPEAGLARELREELGVKATIGAEVYRTVHRYKEHGAPTSLIFYLVRRLSGTPQNRVFERMIWVRPGDLPKYDFLAGDRELVKLLASKRLPLQSEMLAK
jgi:8-oxo-dGTP diphosphatase